MPFLKKDLNPVPRGISASRAIAILGLNVGNNLDKELLKEVLAQEQQGNDDLSRFNRLRKYVESVLHGKAVLLSVVFLCILDCALVMGGLILELNVMKDMSVELTGLRKKMSARTASCWENNTNATNVEQSEGTFGNAVENKVAHIFHYLSIAILAILLLETIVKIIATGKKFFRRKFEIFDAIIVTASFIVDLVYLDGTTKQDNDDMVYNAQVLSFMLPWRVIRVVNSMIVSLMSHEHIKLLLMFKSKRYVEKQVGDLSEDLDVVRQQMAGIKTLAISEGVADWKISKVVGDIFMKTKSKKTTALKAMVSMAVGHAVEQNQSLAVKSKDTSDSETKCNIANGHISMKNVTRCKSVNAVDIQKLIQDRHSHNSTGSRAVQNNKTGVETPNNVSPSGIGNGSIQRENEDIKSASLENLANSDVCYHTARNSDGNNKMPYNDELLFTNQTRRNSLDKTDRKQVKFQTFHSLKPNSRNVASADTEANTLNNPVHSERNKNELDKTTDTSKTGANDSDSPLKASAKNAHDTIINGQHENNKTNHEHPPTSSFEQENSIIHANENNKNDYEGEVANTAQDHDLYFTPESDHVQFQKNSSEC